ncbi:TNFAIP3-interacting protein 3 [Polypterus senegalus]|uniref:TNFAIP3-interacting protein 3 n=1 Tax=Polypterus senegalus TaxID=55291 RepID=UPI001966820E|nr:TNFAIP3-interacting protein 3 [Polypterus senegalus]
MDACPYVSDFCQTAAEPAEQTTCSPPVNADSPVEGSLPGNDGEIDLEERPDGKKLISSGSDENITFISESMIVTSDDEEKLLLLNRNTELRNVNKELLKLNEEWDQIYRRTTMGLQQRVTSLQQEVVGLKQQNEKLLMKLEHEQGKREYFERTLLEELRKNQHLQEYVRYLESKIHRNKVPCVQSEDESQLMVYRLLAGPQLQSSSESLCAAVKGGTHCAPCLESPGNTEQEREPQRHGRGKHESTLCQNFKDKNSVHKEVQDLKEQLQTLKCQTQIYEADYKTEHKDRERMKMENSKLRRKEEEMRQQMALLQEQLKVYEDDFKKERSDKQILQRLLLKKANPNNPVLVHRCNNEPEQGERQGSTRRNTCTKHCEHHSHKVSKSSRTQKQGSPQEISI